MSPSETTYTTTTGKPFTMPTRAPRVKPGIGSNPAPAGCVLTPFGYRPAERVHKVESGQRLRATSQAIEAVDLAGAVVQSFPLETLGDFSAAAANGGWIAWGGWTERYRLAGEDL